MGASYIFYVECFIDGAWHCINPKYPRFKPDYDKHKLRGEYEYMLKSTYYNGSRSAFMRAYDKLCEIGNEIKFSELSEELREIYKSAVASEDTDEGIWRRPSPVAIDYKFLCSYVKDDYYDSHGLIHKDMMFEYKMGEIEDLWPLDHEEAKELTPEEMKSYEYYEWDDWTGFNWGIKQVKAKAYETVWNFIDINFLAEDYETRVIMIGS